MTRHDYCQTTLHTSESAQACRLVRLRGLSPACPAMPLIRSETLQPTVEAWVTDTA